MKVVHLVKDFWPHVGGVETHVLEVSTELVKKKHNVSVITYQNTEDEPLTETFQGITIVRIPLIARDKKSYTWEHIRNHFPLLKQADVIQVHDVGWWLWPSWWQWWKKVSITFHGWETKWPISWRAKLQRRVMSSVCAAVVHVGSWIEKYYGDTPDLVVYGGIHPVNSLTPIKNITGKKRLKVIGIGRIASDNQVAWYQELVKKLREQYGQKNIEWQWLGDGPQRDLITRDCKILGWQKDVQAVLKTADIVFANSYLSILEAQVVGKIVVAATNHPLKKDYLHSYPQQSSLILVHTPAEAITLLQDKTSSKEWSKKVRIAQQWAFKQTWSKVTDQYLILWQKNILLPSV